MSFRLVSLGKVLKAMYADKSDRMSMLRTDIRSEINKVSTAESKKKGGDFHVPFWADAKNHVGGVLDLRETTTDRVDKNDNRSRLYPKLKDGFLLWWEEKRRSRNEPFTLIQEQIKMRLPIENLGVIKIENLLAFTIGESGHRVVAPYFAESPTLGEEAARLGIWAMSQAITIYAQKNMRILDVIRGRSFSILDTPLQGNEAVLFKQKYFQLWKNGITCGKTIPNPLP